jgi:hypothetical protein
MQIGFQRPVMGVPDIHGLIINPRLGQTAPVKISQGADLRLVGFPDGRRIHLEFLAGFDIAKNGLTR